MTLFDLIFIGVLFTAAFLLLAAAATAISGRRRLARGLLLGLGVFISVYLAVVILTSLVSPPRTIPLNEPQCFDDWCVSVDRVDRTQAGANTLYTATIRLHSRARARSQRENGVSVYLLDDLGRRYEAQADPQAVPFNVLLAPGESVIATRQFLAPSDAPNPGLVIAHGRFPGMFIIGDDQSLFHKPSVVQFP